ncbi:uncharacterized protein [Mytilus edulis]|uniref:uncharacterized protein n=1 Tax=Mytilus edulis TaxID=6550 RepID=UPI0039EEA525
MEIEEHDADDTYVKTSAVTAATDLLLTKNLLIIIGKAGIGKSSTALAIASAFHAKGNMVMKLEHDLAKDFKIYYNSRFKQLIIFEDFLGQSEVHNCSKKHADILKVLAPHVHRGLSKFIFTTRTYKIEDAADEIIKCHKLFSNGAIINLNGEFSLSTTEKENILQLHAIKHKINICKKYNTKTMGSKILHYNEFENIIGTDPYLGFPEACQLFCSCDNLFAMGCKFFSSPSEKLLEEIRELRITGYDHGYVALQYCVLTSLMLDNVCKISIGIKKGIIPRESHESLNNLLNINCSMIEFLYRLLYKKKITVTTNDIHDTCNKVSEKYITKEFDRKRYVFLHSTVREAVLLSYWHKSTMDDIIEYCSVDILLEYVRTWDYVNKGHGCYLLVPKSKCKTLVQRLFDICLVCKGAIILCSIVIEKSAFTLNLLNQKLTEWCCTEANVINCGLSKLKKFIRPAQYKNENKRPCAHADENWVIARLINELTKHDCQVKFVRFYIQNYGCNEFVENFNTKLTHWLKSDTNVENCKWEIFKEFVRPTTKIEKGKMGAAVEDTRIIKRLIHELMTMITFDGILDVIWYIKKYGCEEFIRNFNETFSQWLKLEENLMNCKWIVVSKIVRPTSFRIESGKIHAHATHNLLSKRLISELGKPKSDRILVVRTYIKKLVSDNFVKDFNENLTEWLQSEDNVVNCGLDVLYEFVRPTSFNTRSGEIQGHTNDNWLSQRLIKEFLKTGENRVTDVLTYITKYGSKQFVTTFKENLAEWLLIEEHVVNCELTVIYKFVCPTTFKTGCAGIRTHTNDTWLTHRLVSDFVKTGGDRNSNVQTYIQKYGSNKFVTAFTESLNEWLQLEENVANCEMNWLYEFVRPTSFKIDGGEIRAYTNDTWLAQRLLDELLQMKVTIPYYAYNVHGYIKKYGSDTFVNILNKKITEWLQCRENVMLCKLNFLYKFVRPTSFRIESGEIAASTNDNWLTEILINMLLKPEVSTIWNSYSYIKKFGNDDFIRYFNKKFTERLQLHANVKNCNWVVIYELVRPSSFIIETGDVGATTNDNWLTERLSNQLTQSSLYISDSKCNDVIADIKCYMERFGKYDFIKGFNKDLTEWLESQENVINCRWNVIEEFVRPTSFGIGNGVIGAFTNDNWLTKRLVNELVSPDANNVLHVIDYIKAFGSKQFVDGFHIYFTIWLHLGKKVQNSKWGRLLKVIHPTKNYTGDRVVSTTDSWLIQRLIYGLSKSEFEIRTVRQSIEKYGSGEHFIPCFNDKLRAWILENMKTCKWQLFKDVVRPNSFSNICSQFSVCIDDIHVVEYLFEKLNEKTDIFSIKRYILKYGSDEFIVKCNQKLNLKLKPVCDKTNFEYYDYSDRQNIEKDDLYHIPSRKMVLEAKRVNTNLEHFDLSDSNSFHGYTDLSNVSHEINYSESDNAIVFNSSSICYHSEMDFDYFDDALNDYKNSNDDSEVSNYGIDEYFDSSFDSDIDETHNDDDNDGR